MSDSEKNTPSTTDISNRKISSEDTPETGVTPGENPEVDEPEDSSETGNPEESPATEKPDVKQADSELKKEKTPEAKPAASESTEEKASEAGNQKGKPTEHDKKNPDTRASKRPARTAPHRPARNSGARTDSSSVDKLVKMKQKEEENLIGKLLILDKMEELSDRPGESKESWKDIDKEFNKLNKQWSKIGRTPPEKNQELWNRYHTVQDKFHDKRFAEDSRYRQRIENYLTKKKKLIREAEALLDYSDLAAAARDVNKLHRQWKKIGNMPQRDENELWNEFKAATDAFNEKKDENIDVVHQQEEKHLDEKKQLVQQAESLKDSDDWDEVHEKYQKLMGDWKKSGPVPRRQSGKVWKQFKGAMDHFYNRRREHYKDIKKKRKDNLQEKKEVLSKLKELEAHEDPIQAVELAKPLQEEFKSAGYVPIKHKNKLWKEYRETCDVIYERYRAAKSAADVVGRENVSDFSTDDLVNIKNKQKEADKLRGDIQRMQSELLQMEESLSYFKPSGSGSTVLDEVKEKIAGTQKKIEGKENKLKSLDKELDKLTRDA